MTNGRGTDLAWLGQQEGVPLKVPAVGVQGQADHRVQGHTGEDGPPVGWDLAWGSGAVGVDVVRCGVLWRGAV